ncbi:MAG: Gfo/Idh/MocA family oxidoreductase [Desulforhabdus sp.]|nr:Gfo/Idh/MocA family oxidoreductase [Desulforhabdus sp.]
MLRIGVIGYGYWGPNIVRNFKSTKGASVPMICDDRPDACDRARRQHETTTVVSDCREVLRCKEIDAIAVITPVSTHYELARMALENGKHVFVEKPFTANCAEAEQLIELAAKKNLKIMVDHTFLFTGSVKKIKELVDTNTLGKLFYYDSTRVNLGLFQHDVNVIWDLAPHDLSIMDYVLGEKPTALIATGESHFNGSEDIAYITVYFDNNIIAHFNVNWLSPVKVRLTLVGGEKKMLVWNDVVADEKIRVYDKGVEVETREGVYDLLVSYRSGDMWAPKVDRTEALQSEAEYFVHCIMHDETPINDGHAGLRVVKMLEAADRSLKKRGKMVYLQ